MHALVYSQANSRETQANKSKTQELQALREENAAGLAEESSKVKKVEDKNRQLGLQLDDAQSVAEDLRAQVKEVKIKFVYRYGSLTNSLTDRVSAGKSQESPAISAVRA